MNRSRVSASLVSALGLTQIIGYGTLYYSFSILAPGMAQDLGLSAGAGVRGVLRFPFHRRAVGNLHRQADGPAGCGNHHGGRVRAGIGDARAVRRGTFGCDVCHCHHPARGFVRHGAISAAFATLVESDAHSASRSITYLTLIGGFASTIFWPISSVLASHLSWREIYLVFAALNLVVCMPLHVWIRSLGKTARGLPVGAKPTVVGAVPPHMRQRTMLIVSVAFALLGFTLSAMLAHMVPMLGSIGLGAAAVVIGSLFGPPRF